MDYCTNAQETETAAMWLLEGGHYRQAIYMFCLSVELYLKSKLHLVEHREELEASHDIIGIYNSLIKRFIPKSNLKPMINMCRKYFHLCNWIFL